MWMYGSSHCKNKVYRGNASWEMSKSEIDFAKSGGAVWADMAVRGGAITKPQR